VARCGVYPGIGRDANREDVSDKLIWFDERTRFVIFASLPIEYVRDVVPVANPSFGQVTLLLGARLSVVGPITFATNRHAAGTHMSLGKLTLNGNSVVTLQENINLSGTRFS
jgi:hypothetical protein